LATRTLNLPGKKLVAVDLTSLNRGTGKTCLVHRLCTGQPMTSARWTVGCHVAVKLFARTDDQGQRRPLVIEFFDVGGHRNYADSRSVFYHKINGVLLVHDVNNKKSFAHLRTWLDEIVREDAERKARGLSGVEETFFSKREGAGRFSTAQRMNNANPNLARVGPLDGLPILVVGNKSDSGFSAVPAAKMAWDKFEPVATSAVSPGPLFDEEKFVDFFSRVARRRFG